MKIIILAICLLGATVHADEIYSSEQQPDVHAPILCSYNQNTDPSFAVCSGQPVGTLCVVGTDNGTCQRMGMSKQCGCAID